MRRALREKRSGLTPCDFETARIDTYVGTVPVLDDVRVRADLFDSDCRNNRLAQLCLEQDGFAERVAAARGRHGAGRIGFYLGTSTSGLHATELAYRRRDPKTGALPADYRYAETQNAYSLGEFVRRYLGLGGPGFVVSSACSSTAKAFGNAARMIAAGICDAAVVGGADSLCLMTLYGFHSLGLTSPGPCRPFDADRDGISIGEGAGVALVDERDRARAGAVLRLSLEAGSDAYHLSMPPPQGPRGNIATSRALESARRRPANTDATNLPRTATT